MWMTLPLLAAALVAGGYFYIVPRIRRFSFFKKLNERGRALSVFAAAGLLSAVWVFAFINLTAAAVVFLHLVIFWLICDGAGALILRLRGGKRGGGYVAGYAAVAITAVYLAAGWFFAHHIFATSYAFKTGKDLGGDLRIVEIADAHIGATLDGGEFADLCRRVQGEAPDIVVIVGDFVDDDTDRADMERACRALGELETTCGVYFVYGNHDNGYFGYRNFSAADLRRCLEENSVTILEDESVLAGGRFWIVGRRDRSMSGRARAEELTAGLDDGRFILMLDHQPNDYAAEAASGADLVLSGHTHGGHIFPVGLIGLAMGANDQVYGVETRGGTAFVVTSGVSGWAIPFKTGTISEYVVIDITQQ